MFHFSVPVHSERWRTCARVFARPASLLSAWLALPFALVAAPLRVDFSVPQRSDAVAPGWAQWPITGGQQEETLRTAGLTFTLRAVGSSTGAANDRAAASLETVWWKGAAVDGARMAVDAVTAREGTGLELRIRGLRPGPHTLATFHNVTAPAAPLPAEAVFDLSVNGVTRARAVRPSHRVASDDLAASCHVAFEVPSDTDEVVITLRAADATSIAALALCGFELDGADPARRARVPQPADGDEHVLLPAGDDSVRLAWEAAPSAVRHRLYLAATPDALAGIAPLTSRLALEVEGTTATAPAGGPHADQFWRVDSIAADGTVTPGRVWRWREARVAFPGAEGYGRFARGGRGGRVIEVTTLADSGPGSFRAAVEAEGPRTVVFAVSGLITLESRLVVRNPYLTVAGQTAPGKGITIRKYGFGLSGAHDVILRHLRVRPGNIAGITLDGMGMQGSDHSIIDHASISWTLDEAFSSRSARHITLQRTLISEALNDAGHKNYKPGTQHGYAASISGFIGSFHHNLLAHNSGRNWSLAGGLDGAGRHTGWLDIRNNVVFNWQNRTTDGGAARVNFVGNYYKPGPATKVFHLLKPERSNITGFGPQNYFVAGNIMEGRVDADDALGGVTRPEPYENFIVPTPFFPSHITERSARAAYKHVLSDVGCTQPLLDAHDTRVVTETLTGTARYRGSKTGLPGLPDSQDDVGAWEDYPEERRPADWDTDRDGMPDWWERLHGSDAQSAGENFAEANADSDGDGFTALEDYLNWMARPHVGVTRGGVVTVDLAALTRGFTAKPVHRIDAARHGAARVLDEGRSAEFRPAPGFTGLAEFSFTVTDAEGDAMTRTIGVLVQ